MATITFFPPQAKRVVQRSNVGMSQNAGAFTPTPFAELTHPVYAALDHPLFRKRKRGFEEL
jgi:hypothetical protein